MQLRRCATMRGCLGAALLALAFLAACGGGGGGTGSVPGPMTPEEPAPAPQPAPQPAATPVLRFAFDVTTSNRGLVVSAVLPRDGSLRTLRWYDPPELGGSVWSGAAADPLGRFVLLRIGPSSSDSAWTAFSVDATGRLATPGVPATTVIGVSNPVFSADGRFAYLANGSSQVHAFSVAANGRLTEVSGSPFGVAAGANQWQPLALDDSGRLLYLQTQGSLPTPLGVFALDATTGAARPLVRDPTITGKEGGRVAPGGPGRAWVQQADGSWALYRVDADTGNFQPASPALGTGPLGGLGDFSAGLATDPTGRLVLASSAPSGINVRPYRLQLYAFDPAANTLAAVGAPLSVDAAAPWRDPSGRLRQGKLVLDADAARGLRVLASTFVLPSGFTLLPGATAAQPLAFTYGIDADAGRVRVLRADDATGVLQPVAAGSATVTGRPVALAASPRLDVLAVVASSGVDPGTLTAFLVDRASGLLTTMASVATGTAPTAVAFRNDGQAVYVSHRDGIDAFALDAAGGTLRKLPGSPFPTGFAASSVDYATFPPRLTGGGPITDRPAADMVAGGRLLFLATNRGDQGEISTLLAGDVLSVPPTGRADCNFGPTPSESTFRPSGSGTAAVATVPDGSLVYAANRGSNSIAGYRPNFGLCFEASMPAIDGGPFATGSQPVALAMDPSGVFLFAANAGGTGSVSAYAISPFTGRLTEVQGSPFAVGAIPARAWTDAQGRFLYTSTAAGEVKVQSIDRATGSLGTARSGLADGRVHVARDVVLRVQ